MQCGRFQCVTIFFQISTIFVPHITYKCKQATFYKCVLLLTIITTLRNETNQQNKNIAQQWIKTATTRLTEMGFFRIIFVDAL